MPHRALPGGASLVQENLQVLSQRRGESEVVFDRVADAGELARIIRSYCGRVAAAELNLARCGEHLWVRLLRPPSRPLDLVLRWPRENSAEAAGIPPGIPPALGGGHLKSGSGMPIGT